MALDPQLIQQIQALLGPPRPLGFAVAQPTGQGGMFDELAQLLSQYGGTPVQDPGRAYVGSLGPGIGAASPMPKPIVGNPVPGIPDQASQPSGPQAAPSSNPSRNNWLQGNGQPRIPVVHDRTGASADTLSRGQRMRFDNIRNLYGGERAAAARANMLEHNARRPVIPAAPTPAAPPPGAMQVPTMTVPVANIAPEDPAVIAAARRARAIMARPEIPRARRR